MKFILRINTLLLLLVSIALLMPSCSTQKSREDISPLSKFYHNTTSEYNGYYNADVLMQETTLALEEQQKDNYNKVLDIYEYIGADNPQAVAPDLDKAIEKVAIVVSLHRQSHWTDDCYLLMGQAQFLKKDYESAEETFKYMIEEFPEDPAKAKKKKGKKKKVSKKQKEKTAKKKREEREKARKKKKAEAKKKRKKSKKKKKRKKRKKGKKKKKSTKEKETKEEEKVEKPEEEKEKEEKKKDKKDKNPNSPDKYILKHRPAFQEGQLWYARTLIERDKLESADRLFRKIEENPKTFDYIRRELAPAMAYSALKQKRYDTAIGHLESAINLANKKTLKARYAYIIAQLHQKKGNYSEAYAAFEKCIKYNSEFEMEFNAKLQLAQNAWAAGTSTPEAINKKLNKMLSETKNEDYQDQIYYTLGQVALQANDKKGAIENFRLSAKFNKGNLNQKSESYYQLASLFLEDENFVDAKLYYDSTLAVMPNTDERYPDVVKYALNLTGIASSIEAIRLQDSLLTISDLSPEEQKELALKIKQEEERIRLAEAKAEAAKGAAGGTTSKNPKNRTSKIPLQTVQRGVKLPPTFFAYDDKAKKRGVREFKRKWNDRPNVDNWRISSKIEESITDVESSDEEDGLVVTKELTEDQLKSILADVPSNPVEISQANAIIENALFELGKLYRDNLQNNKKTIESLEEMLTRYPKTKNKVEAWYYLYLAHTELGNSAEAQNYFNKIINEAPQSLYATVLKNPNYFKEVLAEEQKVGRYYDQTYAKFTGGDYKEAYNRIKMAENEFGTKNPMKAKFALLGAMSLGSLQGKDKYIQSLKEVIAEYPDTDEQKRAREILRLLGDDTAFAGIDDGADNEFKKDGEKSLFKLDEKDLHYIVVMLEKDADLGKGKADIGKYHRKYFKNESMRVSNIYLGKSAEDRVPIIVIRRFKGKDEAMKYYDGVKKNEKDFLGIDFKYQLYPITQNNYRTILKERSMEGYDEFFKASYLK